MKVCDRCKKPISSDEVSNIGSEQFELCNECSRLIIDHIKSFNPKKPFWNFGR